MRIHKIYYFVFGRRVEIFKGVFNKNKALPRRFLHFKSQIKNCIFPCNSINSVTNRCNFRPV